MSQDSILTIEPGHFDDLRGFRPGNWVELTSEQLEEQGRSGHFVQLAAVEDTQLTVAVGDGETLDLKRGRLGRNPKIRRWDGPLQLIEPGKQMALEQGIVVTFSDGQYRAGDYWLIPARAAVVHGHELPPGGILWPRDGDGESVAQGPAGVTHHYAPLAICDWDDAREQWGEIRDCRHLFPPLATLQNGNSEPTEPEISCCLSVSTVSEIEPTLKRIEEGGTLCLGPGAYYLDKTILVQGTNITIEGCGPQTQLFAGNEMVALQLLGHHLTIRNLHLGGESSLGLIRVESSSNVIIENCHFQSKSGLAVAVTDSDDVVICSNTVKAGASFWVQGDRIKIEENRTAGGGIGVWEGSQQIRIIDNDIIDGFGMGIMLGGLPEEPEVDVKATHKATLDRVPAETWKKVAEHKARSRLLRRGRPEDETPTAVTATEPYDAARHMARISALAEGYSGINGVLIRDNRIRGMSAAGIGTSLAQAELGAVTDVVIEGNHIQDNGWDLASERFVVLPAGIVMETVAKLSIHHNHVEGNGSSGGCGIISIDIYDLSITHNKVNNNGATKDYDGFQAAVWLVDLQGILGEGGDGMSHSPALHFHHNQVMMPMGPALVVTGGGQMNINDNDLQSHDVLRDEVVRSNKQLSEVLGLHISVLNTAQHDVKRSPLLREDNIQFAHNHSRMHAPGERELPLIFLGGTGDLSVQDNQLLSMSSGMAAHLIAYGQTVRVLGNRLLAEPIEGPMSIGVAAEKAAAIRNNQTSHPIVAQIGGQVVLADNSNQYIS